MALIDTISRSCTVSELFRWLNFVSVRQPDDEYCSRLYVPSIGQKLAVRDKEIDVLIAKKRSPPQGKHFILSDIDQNAGVLSKYYIVPDSKNRNT
jgi:hypothetical protein